MSPNGRPQSTVSQRPSSPETRERLIVETALQSQRYPDLTSEKMKNENDVDFKYLYLPLASNPNRLPEREREFIEAINRLKISLRNHAIPEDTIHEYLNNIFRAKNRTELDAMMDSSSIIRINEIPPNSGIEGEIYRSHELYRLYREDLERRLKFTEEHTKKRETVMSQSIDQAKGVAGTLAQQATKIEARWNSMSGQEKLVSGAALLLAFSWFWNSEKSSEIRETLGKALKLGVGLYATNVASKLFLDKRLTELASQKLGGFAGVNDVYKEAFDCNQEETELMAEGIVSLSSLNGMELFKLYLKRKKTYQENPAIHEEQKELMIDETSMDKRKVWRVLSIFDRKYDIEGIYNELEKVKRETEERGERFVAPSFGDIVSAAMLKNVSFRIDEDGRITATPLSQVRRQLQFERTPVGAAARSWWVLTGQPGEWRMRTFSPEEYGRENQRSDHLRHITQYALRSDKPLSDFINQENFKRFNSGFTKLYNEKYKNNPTENFHFLRDTTENTAYATSRTPVDYQTHTNTERAHVMAVAAAYDQAMEKLKREFPSLSDSRLKECAQPVQGVFLTDRNGNYTDYVMFMRLVLPAQTNDDESKSGSIEFRMRNDKQWPEGTVIEMLERTPMRSGEILRYTEFKQIANRLGSGNAVFETFLAKTGLKSGDENEINKILRHFSERYAGKGLSKEGLTAYLATRNYPTEELRNILERDIKRPDIYHVILDATRNTVNARPSLTDDQKRTLISSIMTSVGNEFAIACHGDSEALSKTVTTQNNLNLRAEAATSIINIPAYIAMPNSIGRTNHFNNQLLPIYNKIADKTLDALSRLPSVSTSTSN